MEDLLLFLAALSSSFTLRLLLPLLGEVGTSEEDTLVSSSSSPPHTTDFGGSVKGAGSAARIWLVSILGTFTFGFRGGR